MTPKAPRAPADARRVRRCWMGAILGGLILGANAADAVVLELHNGDRVSGIVQEESPQALVVRTPFGVLRVPVESIERRASVPAADPATPATPGPTSAEVSPPPAARLDSAQATELQRLNAQYRAGAIAAAEYHGRRAALLRGDPWPPPTTAPIAGAPAAPRPRASTPAAPGRAAAAPGPGLKERALKHLRGSLQVGTDLGFGTKDRQLYTARLSLTYARNRLQNTLDYQAAYGRTDQVLSANRMEGTMRTTFDLGRAKRFYAFNAAGAGFDEIRRIDLSYQEGAGLGYKFLTRSNAVLAAELGGQYQEYVYANDTTKQNIALNLGQTLTWNLTPKLLLKEGIHLYPNVDDFADYRVRLDLSLSYPLYKNVMLSLSLIDLYDSRPLPGVRANDVTLQSALGVAF